MAATSTPSTSATSDNGSAGDAADDFLRVYRAVLSGASEEELRRVIEECARGDDQRRKQAVNLGETPLQAAHRIKRGDLVGALVEAGADVGGILFGDRHRCKLTPLAVCIAYGQIESVRALLRAGHDANEKIEWAPPCFHGFDVAPFSTPAHFCLAPPPLGLPSDFFFDGSSIGAPQIGCLEVLLREGGADIFARDSNGQTPIIWLARYGSRYTDEEEKAARDLLVSAGARTSGVFSNQGLSPLMMATYRENTGFARFLIEDAGAPVNERNPVSGETALHCGARAGVEMMALLLDAGADVNARGDKGMTPLFLSVHAGNVAVTRLLLDRGAAVDVIDADGRTPLMMACNNYNYQGWLRDEGWPRFQEILRRSSDETRCSLWSYDYDDESDYEGDAEEESAVDRLGDMLTQRLTSSDDETLRMRKRCCWAISELLASGAPMPPENAAAALPTVAGLSAGPHAELAARLAELRSWRAHETFVGVSLDFKELRGAEREVGERRARVAALELELEELGDGTDDGSSSSSDGESGSSSSGSSGDGSDDDGESTSEGEETEDDAESEGEGEGGTAEGQDG